MDPCIPASEVIARYGLRPHPEGGWYREVYRSGRSVGIPPGYPGERTALTAILYLLRAGEVSVLHRVRSEEVWVHLAGDPLELVVLESDVRSVRLAPALEAGTPLAVVPAGALQGARSLGAWSLVACLVAPGFEFEDFEIPAGDEILARFPEHRDLVSAFTRRAGEG